jgi:hypothetical protein
MIQQFLVLAKDFCGTADRERVGERRPEAPSGTSLRK